MLTNRFEDKIKYGNTQIFKIQTQIRAQLNNLRKTYKQATGLTVKNIQRKHYPDKLYQETLCTPDKLQKNNNSHSQYNLSNRGRKKITIPFNMPDRKSLSPVQRKHFPARYSDNIILEQKRPRHPSACLIRRQTSPTPDKKSSSILSFIQSKQIKIQKPSKKIIPGKHTFIKQFF